MGGEAEVAEEFHVLVGARIGGGEEFVAVEDGVGTGEVGEGLGFTAQVCAAGAEAHFGLRHGDAGYGDHADEREGIDDFVVAERCAFDGHEGVDRNAFGLRIEVGDDLQHFQTVVDGLAEAKDAAAADGHAGVLRVADGAQAVLEGVGADDVRVMLGRGVHVVVVGGDTGFLEVGGFFRAEFAEGDADFHAELGNVAHDVEYLVEFLGAFAHAFPRRAHAEAGGAVRTGGEGAFHDLLLRHELLRLHARGVAGALGAVAAVFAATAGLDAQKGAKLHFVAGPVFIMHGACLLEEVEEGLVINAVKLGEGHGRGIVGANGRDAREK